MYHRCQPSPYIRLYKTAWGKLQIALVHDHRLKPFWWATISSRLKIKHPPIKISSVCVCRPLLLVLFTRLQASAEYMRILDENTAGELKWNRKRLNYCESEEKEARRQECGHRSARQGPKDLALGQTEPNSGFRCSPKCKTIAPRCRPKYLTPKKRFNEVAMQYSIQGVTNTEQILDGQRSVQNKQQTLYWLLWQKYNS